MKRIETIMRSLFLPPFKKGERGGVSFFLAQKNPPVSPFFKGGSCRLLGFSGMVGAIGTMVFSGIPLRLMLAALPPENWLKPLTKPLVLLMHLKKNLLPQV